jgi:transposase
MVLPVTFFMERCQKLNTTQHAELQGIMDDPVSSKDEFLRAQTILLLDAEVRPSAISTLTRYSRTHAFTLRRTYLANGRDAIIDKRTPKPKELLTSHQRADIIETVKTKTPNDIDPYYNSGHWTTGILGEYILRTHGVQYRSKTSYHLISSRRNSPTTSRERYPSGMMSERFRNGALKPENGLKRYGMIPQP